jgi:hypothetical protein
MNTAVSSPSTIIIFTSDTCRITDENETALKVHSVRCTAFNVVKIPNLIGLPNHQTKKMMIHQYSVVVYDISKMEVLVGMFQW